MLALKKLLNKPKLEDGSLLSLFYYCDIAVNHQMQELNTLMRVSPDNLDRRALLIRQLKEAQHNLMNVIMTLADKVIPDRRASRDFRAKYPDDVLLDQINGPIWFGAECIAAGSHIANHELESAELRPYATHLSKVVTKVRQALRQQSYSTSRDTYSQKIKDMLAVFDEVWADFEFRYVSLMCSVKTETQYYHQQDVVVLFCESTLRAIRHKNLTYDMIEMMDPSAMFAIPRLAILCGLVVFPDGPLDPSRPKKDMPQCFRAYRQLLTRIKELLGHLNQDQLATLEKALCSAEGLGTLERNKAAAAARKKTAGTKQGSNTAAAAASPSSSRSPLSSADSSNNTQQQQHHQHHRRHSYDLDSRASVFEPLPSTDNTAEQERETVVVAIPPPPLDQEEPFPHFGVNQPVSNELPSSHLTVPSGTAHHALSSSSPSLSSPPSDDSSKHSNSSTPAAAAAADTTSTNNSPARKAQQKSTPKRTKAKGPAGFPSVEDLMHRLFLGISGVADQLQTNHAKDLRVILKSVFTVCQSETELEEMCVSQESSLCGGDGVGHHYLSSVDQLQPCTPESHSPMITSSQRFDFPTGSLTIEQSPSWIPDSDSPICSVCTGRFSWKRRRHHCRSCGNVVCSHCSPNSLPLFQYGIKKAVRVCTNCYISQLGQISRAVTGISGQLLHV